MRAEDLLQKAYSDLVTAAQNLLMARPGEPLTEGLRKPLADVLRAKGQGKAANNLERGVTMPTGDDKLAAGERRLQTVEDARAAGAGSHANVPKAMPRGVRNNNPGNIRRGADDWQGLAPIEQQTDPAFFRFTSPHFGIRAMARILLNYQSKHGLKTLRDLLRRWAPPSENDTGAYIATVSSRAGISSDSVLDLKNVRLLTDIVSAMIFVENGVQPYDRGDIVQAVTAAIGRA